MHESIASLALRCTIFFLKVDRESGGLRNVVAAVHVLPRILLAARDTHAVIPLADENRKILPQSFLQTLRVVFHRVTVTHQQTEP